MSIWNEVRARAVLELELKELLCNYDRYHLSQKIRSGLLPGTLQLCFRSLFAGNAKFNYDFANPS